MRPRQWPWESQADLKLMTVFGCCQNFDFSDIFWILVPDDNKKIVDVGDQKGQNRHQHLIVVTNTFRLQHPSPTSMKPIEITLRMLVSLKILPNKNMVWWENTIYFIINMNWWIQIFQNEIFNFTFSRAGIFPPRTNWPKLPVSTQWRGWKTPLMLMTSWCWSIYVGDNFWALLMEFKYCWYLLDVGTRCLSWKIVDVGNENGWSRHQHLKAVANTFGLQRRCSQQMIVQKVTIKLFY